MSHVTRTTGIALSPSPGDPTDLLVTDLVDLALRINPRRPHLLVSRVLGKHVPTDPRVVRAAGLLLGLRVGEVLGGPAVDGTHSLRALPAMLASLLRHGGDPSSLAAAVASACSPPPVVAPGLVLGYAETATALGHLVARALGWPSVHSTRREVAGFVSGLDFDEAHSHATAHRVLVDPSVLAGPGPVVLVDDELSTGRTALATVRALHALRPRPAYVVAALVDVRSPADRDAMAAVAAELDTRIDVVSLASGTVTGLSSGAAPHPAGLETGAGAPSSTTESSVIEHDRVWPWRVRETGRHGFGPADEAALDAAAALVAGDLEPSLATGAGGRVLVLGTEELMYAPLAIADALVGPGREVRFSTTTRSPVRVIDVDGYPIRSGISFDAHDRESEPGDRFAYNLGSQPWSDLVLVVDTPALTSRVDGLLAALSSYAGRVHLVVLPSAAGIPEGLAGPAFGSYAEGEVTWLLQDLSHVRLEAPTEVRERAIQAGEAHYAESLPVEYQPEETYRRLFAEQLDEVAPRVATAVGAVTELVAETRGRDDLVLVSLARAGTPIGILMQRWARHRRGRDWPHLAVSIVRDRGIDLVAMRYLAARFDPRRIVFVDGWTGKGAITREFAAAVALVNDALELGGRGFDPGLAVLADPGECVSLYGTRDDFLIPSACLNSTVSGLVSRTVLNADLVGADDFHGAKFYAELAANDVSETFLDAVSSWFDKVGGEVDGEVATLLAADRRPTWVGWAAAERLQAAYGLPSVNLVKPGVGETTRVLLRRVPWQVVVNPSRQADLRHVELLAAERGVAVTPDPDLPYSCVGLIRPTERDAS